MASAAVHSKVVVLLLIHCLLLLPLVVGFLCVASLFCCAVFVPFLLLQSSRWERQRWLLYFGCHLLGVLCLFLTMPWLGLQFVIVAFPGHTHFLV